MKVLLVSRGFPPRIGGVETLCRQLAEGLAARGDDVTVLTFGGRIPRPSVQRGPDYRVLRLPSHGNTFEWSAALAPMLRRLDADVVHVHNLHASVAAGTWASGRRPYVLTTHYHGGGHSVAARLAHQPYRMLARRVIAGAAAVTAVSASEADLLSRDFGVVPEIIPNGVDPYPAGVRRPPATPTLVVVSRLLAYKRVDAVIRALPELPGFRLTVIGDGPYRKPLRGLADRLGVGARVDFRTRPLSDEDLRTALRDASVHVNLSAAEAFSYTVLESLAAGTPVVTSGEGALAAWSRRFPGAVRAVEPGDPARVSAAVRDLAGRRVRVDLAEYALPGILDRYQRLYERAARVRVAA